MYLDTNSHHDSINSQNQPGLVLPTPSMQNQIHELAKTLPPPRKQNTACDACRARKVKCNRLQGHDKCQHCLSKNYPCTNYVQQATSEKRRSTNVSRRPRINSASSRYVPPILVSQGYPVARSEGRTSPPSSSSSPGPSSLASSSAENGNTPSSEIISNQFPIRLSFNQAFHPPITITTPTREVLAYLFAPPEDNLYGQSGARTPYADWGDLAFRLEDAAFRAEFTLDLVEVFFQIVHTRIPLLNPPQFRSRLNLQDSGPVSFDKPLHPALVSTVVAWGTKFSEHPLLVADRKRQGGQSALAKCLIDRAREVAEALKVHRIASSEHITISLLIEPLQSQTPDDPSGFHGFWLTTAIHHLLDMQINHKSVMSNIQDSEARGTMIFAWWFSCIADAYGAAYYRRKPILDDEDYDIDFYTVEPVSRNAADSNTPMPSPREQLEFLGYYTAAHALARITRQMSRQLWRPAAESDGVPFEVVCGFTNALTEWRDQYLTVVGVPSNFESEWNFVQAVSACASDASFHVMWIILFSALDDFGIREINMNNPSTSIPNHAQIEAEKRKVTDQALHSALRIAGLAGVLTSNGYLRLDPAVMYISCIHAGTFLARLGRPEVQNCIAGLEQYSYAYVEAGDQAHEMKRLYDQARTGQAELNHMSSAAPFTRGATTAEHSPTHHTSAGHSMMVDEPMIGGDRDSSPRSFATSDSFSSIYTT